MHQNPNVFNTQKTSINEKLSSYSWTIYTQIITIIIHFSNITPVVKTLSYVWRWSTSRASFKPIAPGKPDGPCVLKPMGNLGSNGLRRFFQWYKLHSLPPYPCSILQYLKLNKNRTKKFMYSTLKTKVISPS